MNIGFARVKVRISSPERAEPEESIKLLVDTGAMLSVIPRSVLRRLSIGPIGTREFGASGGALSRQTGGVQITYEGAASIVPVVLGEEGDPSVMGARSLST